MLKHLQQVRPDLKFSAPEKSPVKGLYYTSIENGPTIYVTQDGKHFFAGDLFEVSPQGFVNLSERKKEGARKVAMEKLSTDDLIVFGPQKPKAHVYVFTDVDCHYCRKLHQQIAEYNNRDMAVRYVFFPRSGPNTPSYHKAERVWCAEDQRAAMTQAKTTGDYKGEKSCQTPVMDHLRLARALGLRGTPAILLQDGELDGGLWSMNRFLADYMGDPFPDVDFGFPSPTGMWRCPNVGPDDDQLIRLTHAGVVHHAPNRWLFTYAVVNEDLGTARFISDTLAGWDSRWPNRHWRRADVVPQPTETMSLMCNTVYYFEGHGHDDAREYFATADEIIDQPEGASPNRSSHDSVKKLPAVYLDGHSEPLPQTANFWKQNIASYSSNGPAYQLSEKEVKHLMWFVRRSDLGGGGGGGD